MGIKISEFSLNTKKKELKSIREVMLKTSEKLQKSSEEYKQLQKLLRLVNALIEIREAEEDLEISSESGSKAMAGSMTILDENDDISDITTREISFEELSALIKKIE